MAFTLAPFVASTTLTQSAGAIPAFSLDSTVIQTTGNLPAFSLNSTLSRSVGNLPAFIATQDGPSTFSFVASGGVQFGGQATRSFLLNGQPAYDTFSFSLIGSGGMLFGGSASVSAVQLTISEFYPLGGVKFGGSAGVATSWLEYYPSGGIKFGGGARFVDPVRGSGGIKFGGEAVVGTLTGSVSATLPRLQAALVAELAQATTGSISVSLPRVVVDAVALNGSVARIAATLPVMRAGLLGGRYAISAKLPSVGAKVSGASGIVGGINATVRGPSATITAQAGVGGSVSASIPRVSASLTGLTGVVGGISARLANMTMTGSSVVGVTAQISGKLPRLKCTINAAQAINATMSLTLPRVSARLTADYAAELIMTFVTNTLSAASTTFSDYPFNSFCEIDGEYFGAASDGLYKLDVPQEDVPFKMTTGLLSFKIPQQKRASDFYMNLHSKGDLVLRVSVDEGEKFEYPLSPEDVSSLRQRRSVLGKGLRGVYWQFELEGAKDFDFDNYAVAFAPTARRV